MGCSIVWIVRFGAFQRDVCVHHERRTTKNKNAFPLLHILCFIMAFANGMRSRCNQTLCLTLVHRFLPFLSLHSNSVCILHLAGCICLWRETLIAYRGSCAILFSRTKSSIQCIVLNTKCTYLYLSAQCVRIDRSEMAGLWYGIDVRHTKCICKTHFIEIL